MHIQFPSNTTSDILPAAALDIARRLDNPYGDDRGLGIGESGGLLNGEPELSDQVNWPERDCNGLHAAMLDKCFTQRRNSGLDDKQHGRASVERSAAQTSVRINDRAGHCRIAKTDIEPFTRRLTGPSELLGAFPYWGALAKGS